MHDDQSGALRGAGRRHGEEEAGADQDEGSSSSSRAWQSTQDVLGAWQRSRSAPLSGRLKSSPVVGLWQLGCTCAVPMVGCGVFGGVLEGGQDCVG